MNKSHLLFLSLLSVLGMTSCYKHPMPPANRVASIEGVTHTSAIIRAEILEESIHSFSSGIVFAQHQQPNLNDSSIRNDLSFPFRIPLIGLEYNTTYYIRAYTKNEAGVTYSEEAQFTTDQVDLFVDPRDGNVYPEVQIFEQVWMGENMRYEIPGKSRTVKNEFGEKQEEIYGLLYPMEVCEAVCPSGWHLPTDEDWKVLEYNVEMPAELLDELGRRETDGAAMLREPGKKHWESDYDDITNSLGFTAMAAGFFNGYSGRNASLGYAACFWTAPNDSGVYYPRVMWPQSFYNKGINRYDETNETNEGDCFSVRCIKDN
ncbi:MAG: hypothetical protein JW801_15345 [Bacteroidales bacterium]|nr:hypothetical protein [Bacteroidales bacterium]